MKKQVYKIDTNNFLEEICLAEFDELDNLTDSIETNTITVDPPHGLYKAKWDGEKWVEGGTAPQSTSEQEIARLKTELTATDYKIIKCSEYQLAGQTLPYDIAALHADRQELRDKINTLESSLVAAQ